MDDELDIVEGADEFEAAEADAGEPAEEAAVHVEDEIEAAEEANEAAGDAGVDSVPDVADAPEVVTESENVGSDATIEGDDASE